MRGNRLVAASISAALLVATPAALAHHAFAAEFDANKPLTLTGTVTKVEWQNPHTWFYVDVKDESGSVTNWAWELASPNLLMRNGWTRSSMNIGDVVTIEGFHAKNGAPIGNARRVTLTATGKTLLTGSTGAQP